MKIEELFMKKTFYILVCHGQPGTGAGSMPDLTMSSESIFNNYTKILKEGALLPLGMPNFGA